MQTERSMTIDEGSYANYVYDTQRAELAIVDPSSKDYDQQVVVPGSLLARRGEILSMFVQRRFELGDALPA